MGKVLGIVNRKGGVGKTTTATTLSYLLSKEGCKVALIDFDGQRHTTKLCGVTTPEQLSVTIYDILKCIVMNEELPDKESYMIRTETGVDLIPANNKLDNFDKLMCDTDFAEYKLKEFVDTIKEQYDYILIDGMPKMGTAMINVMICADSLIIPVQSETLAVEGMAEFLRAFHRIKSHANARLEIEGILITMDNERTRVSKRVKAQLQQALGEKVRIFTNSIPRSIKVPEAVEYLHDYDEIRSEVTNMTQFEMKQLAYQSQLKSRALQVLLYLIDRANKEQTCFPAVSTIGRELHISISTVKRAMRELVEAGYVKKESRFREGNRGQTSNLYTLFFTEDRAEQQKENEEIQQEEEPVNVSEKHMEKEEQFENTKNCAGESSVYVDVTGGGGQNDTTLNSQFNQELKGEKEVFRKPKLFQVLGNALSFCFIQTARHVCLFGARKTVTHNGIFAVSEPNEINAVIPASELVRIPCVKKGILVHGVPV